MYCVGCGNSAAIVTRTWHDGERMVEICDSPDCGDLKTPWMPDVYFRRPSVEENLGDSEHPFGQLVESPRHKARILREQGLREDGDLHHGSRDKGVRKREFKLTPKLEAIRDAAVKKAIVDLKKKNGAPIDRPLKMLRRK